MKYRILNILKQNNDYVSGEDIGTSLGISRSAVWKNIVKLKEMGYDIESVSNRGYRLSENYDVLNENEIDYDRFIYIPEVDSTNEECKRRANGNCPDGILITCDRQTAGKGRLGRSWSAENGEGLYMSMVLRPDIMPVDTPQITLIAGIAVRNVIESLTGIKPQIKWPNDIIINGRKFVGILTEMNAEMEKVNYIVLGIGINVNNQSFEGELKQKATSIYIETGKRYKRCDIINEFIKVFKAYYDTFLKYGFKPFAKEYNENCANVNKSVKTVGTKNTVTGIAKGVNDKGELIISDNGREVRVFAGEVSLRTNNDTYI